MQYNLRLKGKYNHFCANIHCKKYNATWYNTLDDKYYCSSCAELIGFHYSRLLIPYFDVFVEDKMDRHMFRQDKMHPIVNENFGAGSIINIDNGRLFLVVATSNKQVALINMQNFSSAGISISVGDSNFLTEEEARKLVDLLYKEYNMNHTFTDAILIPSGIKNYVELLKIRS